MISQKKSKTRRHKLFEAHNTYVGEIAKTRYNRTTIDSGTKIAKNTENDQANSFWDFRKILKHMPRVVFDKESKTGLDFEIGQPQQKFQRRPTLQSMANPAVYMYGIWLLG